MMSAPVESVWWVHSSRMENPACLHRQGSRVEGRVLPEKAFELGPQGEEGLELKNREMGAVG